MSTTETIATRRDLDIEVVFNVRHLGGLRTRDGRRTRASVVRAGSLHRLTPAGIETLAALGVRTIVDLRSPTEHEQAPSPDLGQAGIQRVAVPVFETDASPLAFTENFQGFGPIYQQFLEGGRDAYRALFESIVATDGTVLFHYAAGKDRTGVAAALLLELAGVPDEEIIEDYRVSAANLRASMERHPMDPAQREKLREAGLTDEMIAKLMGSEPEYMVQTLTYIRRRWGSAEGYMHDLGLDGKKVESLYERLVA